MANPKVNIWAADANVVFGMPEAIRVLKADLGLLVQKPNLTSEPRVDVTEVDEFGRPALRALDDPTEFAITGTLDGIVVDAAKFFSVTHFTLWDKTFICGARPRPYEAAGFLKVSLPVTSDPGITGAPRAATYA